MIPKTIWQSHRYNREDLPKINSEYNLYDLSKRWETMNPEYEYVYFNDNQLNDYVKNSDADLYECILECDRIKCGAMKADIFRYLVIYQEGGFWADMDTVPWRPIDDWYVDGESFVVSEEIGRSDTLNQYFFGAEAGHPALKLLLDSIKEKFAQGIDYSNDMWEHDSAGPRIFGQTILKYNKEHGNPINIYPPKYFDDMDPKIAHLFHAVASMNWNTGGYISWRDTFKGRYEK